MIEHHILSPHRDDGFLTFGGFILERIDLQEPVFMHLIHGIDGYIRPEFKDQLLIQGIRHPHLKRLKRMLAQNSETDSVFEEIDFRRQQRNDNRNNIRLGMLVRSLEDQAVAALSGYSLINYDFPCGYPLRGYSAYNAPIREDDQDIQLKSHLYGLNTPDAYNLARGLGVSQPNLNSFFLDILTRRKESPDAKFHLYFPSGIGGHPDHLILCAAGMNIVDQKLPNMHIFFGQDLPYAMVPEWFQRSNLPFNSVEKVIVDITYVKERKMDILSVYHSQLNDEDLRLARLYPHYLLDMLHGDFFRKDDVFNRDTQGRRAVEIQYKFL